MIPEAAIRCARRWATACNCGSNNNARMPRRARCALSAPSTLLTPPLARREELDAIGVEVTGAATEDDTPSTLTRRTVTGCDDELATGAGDADTETGWGLAEVR